MPRRREVKGKEKRQRERKSPSSDRKILCPEERDCFAQKSWDPSIGVHGVKVAMECMPCREANSFSAAQARGAQFTVSQHSDSCR
jgi:hypothetical protein